MGSVLTTCRKEAKAGFPSQLIGAYRLDDTNIKNDNNKHHSSSNINSIHNNACSNSNHSSKQ